MAARFLTDGMNASMMAARLIAPSASMSSQGLPEVANPQGGPKAQSPGEGERAVRALTNRAKRWRMLVNGRLWVERRNFPMVESFTVAPGDSFYWLVARSTLKLMSAVLTAGPLPETDGLHYSVTSSVFAHDVPQLRKLGRALSSRKYANRVEDIIASSSPGFFYALNISASSNLVGFAISPAFEGRSISMYVFDGGRAFKPFTDSVRLFARVGYEYGRGSLEINLSQRLLGKMNVGSGEELSEDGPASFNGEVLGRRG